MKRILRHMSYANVMATIAMVSALTTGGALAAGLLTGVNVKNGSLKNGDFKNRSLTDADLSPAAMTALVGLKGDTGFQGSQGDMGSQGPNGDAGNPGNPANLTSSWAYQDTGLMTSTADDVDAPNSPALPWDSLAYGSTSGLGGTQLNLRTPASYTAVDLSNTWTPIVALEGVTFVGIGQSGGSQGLITTPWAGRLNANATLSFLHRNDGENLTTNDPASGTVRNVRVQCKVAYGSGNDFSTFTTLGVSTYASSNATHELIDVSVMGDADTSVDLVPAGTYNVATLCRDVDYTGSTQWSLVNANMTTVGSG